MKKLVYARAAGFFNKFFRGFLLFAYYYNALFNKLQDVLNDLRIELLAFVLFKLFNDNFFCQLFTVASVAVHGVKRVGNADNTCDKRDLSARS